MKFSENADDRKLIFSALVKAQADISAVSKDASNPHFNSSYADLAAILVEAQKAMKAHGLALTFSVEATDDGGAVVLDPVLIHESGQVIVFNSFRIPVGQKTAQAQGSAITYGRRYLTQTILGIPTEDDDGNGAQPPAKPDQKPAPRPAATSAKPEASKAVTPDEAAFKGRLKAVTAYLVDNKPVLTKAQADELREALHKAKTVEALDAVQKACGECLVLNAQANAVAAGMGGTVE